MILVLAEQTSGLVALGALDFACAFGQTTVHDLVALLIGAVKQGIITFCHHPINSSLKEYFNYILTTDLLHKKVWNLLLALKMRAAQALMPLLLLDKRAEVILHAFFAKVVLTAH